ncbi:MAG: glycosyltransferase family 39 protein [Candidatus Omnitrophica bacterium]|nr:glycosyltransferase family 39 protein [Candidatus Omnitrophota bacterium]MDD5488269.1 glycosyltransferase family 39 protein [Candidatus Omnitrophota bacterium]
MGLTIPALICTSFIVLLAWAIGEKLLALERIPSLRGLERAVTAQALGFGIISSLVFALGLVDWLSRPAIMFLLLILVLVRKELLSCSLSAWRAVSALKNVFSKAGWDISAIFLLFLLLSFLGALLPPSALDEIQYHLFFPKLYASTGSISCDLSDIYGFFPQLAEMLYTLAVLLSNYISAHFLHCYFGLLSFAVIFFTVSRAANTRIAFLSALIFYAIPSTSLISTIAYVDLALCAYILLGTSLFASALISGDRVRSALAGIMFGFACGVKYTALFSLPICAIILLGWMLLHPADKKRTAISGSIFLACLLAAGFPWYLRNIMQTGNPFYPFFSPFFGTGPWGAERPLLYDILLKTTYGMGASIRDILRLPFNLFLYAGPNRPFDGMLGPIYLVLPVLLLFRQPRDKEGLVYLSYSLLFLFIWAGTSQQIRLMLPAAGVLACVFYPALTLSASGGKHGKTAFYGLINLALLYQLLLSASLIFSPVDIAYLFRGASSHSVLEEKVSNFNAIDYINRSLPDTSLTCLVNIGNVRYYCERPFVQESVFEGWSLFKAIDKASSGADISNWFTSRGITHLLIDEHVSGPRIAAEGGLKSAVAYKDFLENYTRPVFRNGSVAVYELIPGRPLSRAAS